MYLMSCLKIQLVIKKLQRIVIALFIRCWKLNISFVAIKQLQFVVPKKVRLNSTQYFVLKIPNKLEFWQIIFNHLSDIVFDEFMKIYLKCTNEPYFFLVNDATLPSDHLLRLQINRIQQI